MGKKENEEYLSRQILTYIGNKRDLLEEISEFVFLIQKELKKDKLICLDLFSGSGVVARVLKQYSEKIIVNDLEKYSYVLNECFLANKSEFDEAKFNEYLSIINENIRNKPIKDGIINNFYSPKDENEIKKEDRVFYTKENAIYIDSFRYYIKLIPKDYQKYFLALLLVEASIHVNTCGVFKGFYKDKKTNIGKYGGEGENALKRIKGKINITPPNLSNYECQYEIYNEDSNTLVKKLDLVDLAYLDPPYNEHPYRSNYFMLNIICENKINSSSLSKVSGIPSNWNRSDFNNKNKALNKMNDLVSSLKARFILVSYNNEGFISFKEMIDLLSSYGKVTYKRIKYNTFRGSRNLNKRNLHTEEYLFLLRKDEYYDW